jgi:hypothetical protein
MKGNRTLRVVLALISAVAYGAATWTKLASSHYSTGAWLIGTPVALILIFGITYLLLRGRQSAKSPPN